MSAPLLRNLDILLNSELSMNNHIAKNHHRLFWPFATNTQHQPLSIEAGPRGPCGVTRSDQIGLWL
jgi:hypothetical protein